MKSGQKNRKKMILLGICFLIIVLLFVSLIVYEKIIDEKTMGNRISVYGLEISKLPLEQAAEKISDKFLDTEVAFYENGSEVYKTTLKKLGYTLDMEHLQQTLSDIKEERMKNRGLFLKRKDFQIDYQINRNKEVETEALARKQFEISEDRKESTDAYIKYNEKEGEFTIVDEVLGNQIDESKLMDYTHEILEEEFAQNLLQDAVKVELGTQVYQEAAVAADEENLNNQLIELNQQLQQYRNTSVTYTFGETEELLSSEEIRSWLVVNDEGMAIDEEAAKAYISDLGTKYNTIYKKRYFQTSSGDEVEISGNEYGFRIDADTELQQLLEDLKSGAAIRREPVYSKQGLSRNGKDDLQGSYIEVSIDSQHLWLYKDGDLITETDIISGLPTEEKATYRGAWPIAYKKSPYTLTSDIYGYERDVTYWMPFVYGQGLHDASWKSSFGGELYKTEGSHGCVNLPLDQAKIIYDTISAGYPIIIY